MWNWVRLTVMWVPHFKIFSHLILLTDLWNQKCTCLYNNSTLYSRTTKTQLLLSHLCIGQLLCVCILHTYNTVNGRFNSKLKASVHKLQGHAKCNRNQSSLITWQSTVQDRVLWLCLHFLFALNNTFLTFLFLFILFLFL